MPVPFFLITDPGFGYVAPVTATAVLTACIIFAVTAAGTVWLIRRFIPRGILRCVLIVAAVLLCASVSFRQVLISWVFSNMHF